MMKKLMTYAKKVMSLATLSALSAVAVLSCGDSSGLGPEVDLTAPVVSLTSHQDNNTVPSGFTLAGTAYDNEAVTRITIDFEDADLHYQVVPGSGVWQKKTATTEWTAVADGDGSCVSAGALWEWSVYVDTTEATESKDDTTYTFTLIAEDHNGNSSKNSKVDCSLIVDENNPDVTIFKPDLFNGTYEAAKTAADTYALQDGNVIARLLNGDLVISGRQSNSIAFKELRITFDNGKLSGGTVKITGDARPSATTADTVAQEVPLGEEETPTIYYTKTLRVGEDGIVDLRNWELTVPQSDWVTDEKNPEFKSGKHLVRIVTTSVSEALAWQRKVIGYFVWYPEADTPWLVTYIGDDSDLGDNAYSVYPSSNFSGTAQDDDGIASLVYTLDKKDDNGDWVTYQEQTALGLSEAGAKYSAWSVRVPSDNGNFRLSVTVTDLYGKTAAITKYFRTLDVQPPKINIVTPENGTSILITQNGDVSFTGTVSDDGTVTSCAVVYLNPAKNDDPENKIKYMSGIHEDWDKASDAGYTDANGNIVYRLTLGAPVYDEDAKANVYALSKTCNLFSDLGINGTTRPLESQDFIFRAVDNGNTNTVQTITLLGDAQAPTLTVDRIQLFGSDGTTKKDEAFTDSSIPNLPLIRSGDYAIISGTWGDNSTDLWGADRINQIKLEWLEAPYTVQRNPNGTWRATVTNVPGMSGVITASLTDFGGNTKTASRSVLVETASVGLERIGTVDELGDGAYTTGIDIGITLEFTKNTNITYTTAPTLTLNNGGTATYTTGHGTAKHEFHYTVRAGDDIEKLGVSKINTNGAKWSDTAGTEFDVILPTVSTKRLETTRNIRIDTTSPTVKSVTAITPSGSYKKGASIILMLEFSENVTVTNADTIKLSFAHTNGSAQFTSDSATMSGSKYVLFTHTVLDGENTSRLALSSLSGGSATATDEAGNTLSSWALPATTLNNAIVIDTNKPVAPTVTPNWTVSPVFDDGGTSFKVSGGETGATIEYTTDGTNWITCKNNQTVTLLNNGDYTIRARQTDVAGNLSDHSAEQTVTVDKGALLTRITADTVSGTYSTKTNTKAIQGKIIFRKNVTIARGATVTLNVKNGIETSKTVDINECMSVDATKSEFTFTYTIREGDAINATDGLLDVTNWSFPSVSYGTQTVTMGVPAAGSGKRFKENREIKILTGNPTVQTVTLTGTGASAKLTVTFDRAISKVGGNITFTQDTASDKYHVPAVLSVSEYNDVLNAYSNLYKYYTAGVNGATLSGSTLTNDTTTKYILNFDKDDTDADLITAFTTNAKKHIVTVPVVASAVATSGKTLTVTLGSTYKLPVMGATYTVALPASMVTDEVQNKNDAWSDTRVAEGVEPPTIRIKKDAYTITGAGNTKNATVSMPATAQMRMDCRTPDAKIYYTQQQKTSSTVHVNQSPNTDYSTQLTTPPSPTTPTSSSTAYTNNSTLTLGTAISNYNSATGMKFAIAARAYKNNSPSDISYEYATRSVLRLTISGKYDTQNGANGNTQTHITENNDGARTVQSGQTGNLYFRDLQVWVIGGDSPLGGNSIGTFPLSWGESKNFKLMTGTRTTDYNMYGTWYWVSWDISADAYHGFVIGDVPTDASDNGPMVWYAAECAWVAQKEHYPLHPGETLEMAIEDAGAYQANFMFRIKNIGTR